MEKFMMPRFIIIIQLTGFAALKAKFQFNGKK